MVNRKRKRSHLAIYIFTTELFYEVEVTYIGRNFLARIAGCLELCRACGSIFFICSCCLCSMRQSSVEVKCSNNCRGTFEERPTAHNYEGVMGLRHFAASNSFRVLFVSKEIVPSSPPYLNCCVISFVVFFSIEEKRSNNNSGHFCRTIRLQRMSSRSFEGRC